MTLVLRCARIVVSPKRSDNTNKRGFQMAKKSVLTINSVFPYLYGAEGYACQVCGKHISPSHSPVRAAWVSHATGLILDPMGDYDFSEHSEDLVCEKCEDKFDPDALMQAM